MDDASGCRRRRVAVLLVCALFLTLCTPAQASFWGNGEPALGGSSWDILPNWMAEETAHPGTVEVIKYFSHFHGSTGARCGIYLPAGYAPDRCYDVVFLWPGTNGDYRSALLKEQTLRLQDGTDVELTLAHLLDRLIEEGRVRPFILVCMQDMVGSNAVPAKRDVADMIDRLVEMGYGLYPRESDLSEEELREHYSFFGFSQGAIFVETAGIGYLYDLFANYGAVSYGSTWDYLQDVINESDLPMGLFYAARGSHDDPGGTLTTASFQRLVDGCEKLEEGGNAVFLRSEQYVHGYDLMDVALVDFLQRILPPGVTVGDQ